MQPRRLQAGSFDFRRVAARADMDMGAVSPAVTALAIIVAVALAGMVIAAVRGRAVFRGYDEIAANARRIAHLLNGEVFRDGDDLVVSGNYARLPVVVRFSYGENTPGVNVRMEAPTNFTLSIVPRGMPGEGRVMMHAPDDSFDARFTTRSDHPTQAKMFLGGKQAFIAVQKLCASGRTLLTIANGRVELSELAYPTEASSRLVIGHLAALAEMARSAGVMPGASLVAVKPIRRGLSWVTRAAIAAGVIAALAGVLAASRDFESLGNLPLFSATIPEGVLPADALAIANVAAWKLAPPSEFDPDAAAWLRGSGAPLATRVAADFRGTGRAADVTYLFTDQKGTRRLVLLAGGENRYDVRYPYIGIVARVKKEQVSSIDWTERPPQEPDGDGILIVRAARDRASGLVLFTQGSRIISGVPADYQRIHPSE